MSRKPQEDTRSRAERLQAILRLIREHPISRQEELQAYLNDEGYEVTQATISRDIRELCLVNVSSHSDRYDPKVQDRFETIFRESVLGVDYAGHIVMIKCYPGMANAACQVFDSMQWKNVVGSLSGDDTFLVVVRTERDAKNISAELERYIARK